MKSVVHAYLGLIAFMLFSSLGISLIPSIEQPDFSVRWPEFVEVINKIYSFFFGVSAFDGVDGALRDCSVDSGVYSIVSTIEGCTIGVSVVIIRPFISAIVILLSVLIFRKHAGFYSGDRIVLFGGLISPGMIFYANMMSMESIAIIISFFLSFMQWKWFSYILLAIISIIDSGTATVVSLFVILRSAYRSQKIEGAAPYILIFGFLAFIASFRNEILSFLFDVTGYFKFQSLFAKISSETETNQYPVYLRPIITMMTAVDMKPSGLKVVTATLIFWIAFAFSLYRVRFKMSHEYLSSIKAIALTVLIFVFLLPQYANAKYYIWSIHIFIYPMVIFLGSAGAIYLMLFLNGMIFFMISIYRL